MIQEIFTYIIITFAVSYTLYNFVMFMIPSKNKNKQHSCSGGCSGCAMKNELKDTMKLSKIKDLNLN